MKKTLSILLILIAILCGTVYWLLNASLPSIHEQTSVAGLSATAELRYDEWQRPYVNAASLQDAVSVQGWLHASHRLWQMELFRRAGKGRMAELFGAGLLRADISLWRIGVPQLGARLERHAAPETLALIDSYLAGINEAIENYTLLPPEFLLLRADIKPWQRSDVFAVGALVAFQSANNMDNELVRLALSTKLDVAHFDGFAQEHLHDDYSYVLPQTVDSAALTGTIDALATTSPSHNPLMPRLGFGSNGWVVAPQASSEGVPLFAFDSHDELGLPNLFYEVHLFFDGGKQLRGWSTPGLPGVINGFNTKIAWGFTNIGDTQDVFIETRSDKDARLFLDGGQWYEAETETVSIPVAGTSPHKLTLTTTRNGPLVSDNPPLSLAWTAGQLERPTLDGLFALNLATDWPSFNRALDALPAPTLNATYADVDRNIGFRTGGVIPLRGAGNGRMPLDGSKQRNRWQGMVPATQMPRRFNPPEGFLAAANARINSPGAGPLVSADNAAPYRINRIKQVLSEKRLFTPKDMQALQNDWTDPQAQLLLPKMLADIQAESLNAQADTAMQLLQQWINNPVAAADSAAAVVFQAWYLELAETVFAQTLDELWPRVLRSSYLLNQALDQLILDDGASIWWRDNKGGLLARALDNTVIKLTEQLGADAGSWRLDQLQHLQLGHELGNTHPLLGLLFNAAARPWGGSASTVGRAAYPYDQPFAIAHGATIRTVAAMSNPPRVASVFPSGQSGHPLSKHYNDQTTYWLQGELLPIAADPARLDGPVFKLVPQ